ncbi:MAG: type I-E CRISPR-associated protein Cas5/CasD [Deltaproteobacteria bacterium]|nr:type I-E CRISPR-associated protein Cas5/CasD [Deltaproteobacteria bacterium]
MARHTLLMRLAGPMQSWGSQSRFSVRDTGLVPTKSGVIGLLCAALGRDRARPVEDLAALRFGVRVDSEGIMMKDFHTVLDVIKASGAKGKDAVISTRYYLADADFLVGLEGTDLELLRTLDHALGRPVWPLFLGRKSFPPAAPVRVPQGLVRETSLEDALSAHPWPRPLARMPRKPPGALRMVLETPFGEGETVVRDQPHGAAYADRSFLDRHATTVYLRLDEQVPVREEEACTSPN